MDETGIIKLIDEGIRTMEDNIDVLEVEDKNLFNHGARNILIELKKAIEDGEWGELCYPTWLEEKSPAPRPGQGW